MALLMAEHVTAPLANVVVTVPVANMYSRANANADVVSQAIYGANVQVLTRRGRWVRIQTSDRYSGWVTSSSVLRRPP